MSMRHLSNEAFATLAICGKSKQHFGITVDSVSKNKFVIVWSFKIDEEKAHREHFDQTKITGSFEIDQDFPGCPYCGAKRLVVCQCGALICYNGEEKITCPKCGRIGTIKKVAEYISIKGGGY